MAKRQKPYDWSQFTLRIVVAAPVSRVFEAWTKDRIVSKWFTEKTKIGPTKGGVVHFEWAAGDKWDTTVTAISKNRYFQFPFGTKGEQVKVSFKKAGKGTICEIHQFGMKTGAQDKAVMHLGCTQGWTFFLANLKAYLEHGIDLRAHDPKRSYRQKYVNS